MESDDVLQDVRRWLDRHGYVLEMEVAREFLPICDCVIQGHRYVDPVTNKSRETDIFCSWLDRSGDGARHVVLATIECKSTTAPWVLFTTGPLPDFSGIPHFVKGDFCDRCNGIFSALESLGGNPKYLAYAVAEKRSERATKDHAYEAVQSVMSAAISMTPDSDIIAEYQFHYQCATIPLIVTRGPLVACRLDSRGDVILSRVDRCWVSAAREKIDHRVNSLIVSFSGFHEFMRDLGGVLRQFGLE